MIQADTTAFRPDPLRQRLVAALHVAKKQLGLDDDTYRDALEAATGKRSAGHCSTEELDRALSHFRARGAAPRKSPYLRKLQALWISGWNLGVIRDNSDKAMEGFIFRQTGIGSSRWLRDAGDARRVIEALKSWIEREAAFRLDDAHPARSVAEAQWRILAGHGGVAGFADLNSFGRTTVGGEPADWDNAAWVDISRALGRRLRKQIAA